MKSFRLNLIVGVCSLFLLASFGNQNVSDKIPNDKTRCSYTASFIDPRDSTSYNTVKIGNQIWMAENLRWLPKVSPADTGSQISDFYYVYDYHGANVAEAKSTEMFEKYGVLYNWQAAMVACPEGWRLPSDDDWHELIDFIINNSIEFNEDNVGNSLKSNKYWSSVAGIDYEIAKGRKGFKFKGTDDYCFSALPGGFRSFFNNNFKNKTLYGLWWSSSEISLTKSSYWVLSHHSGWILNNFIFDMHRQGYYSSESEFYKASGYSVRCIRND